MSADTYYPSSSRELVLKYSMWKYNILYAPLIYHLLSVWDSRACCSVEKDEGVCSWKSSTSSLSSFSSPSRIIHFFSTARQTHKLEGVIGFGRESEMYRRFGELKYYLRDSRGNTFNHVNKHVDFHLKDCVYLDLLVLNLFFFFFGFYFHQ